MIGNTNIRLKSETKYQYWTKTLKFKKLKPLPKSSIEHRHVTSQYFIRYRSLNVQFCFNERFQIRSFSYVQKTILQRRQRYFSTENIS